MDAVRQEQRGAVRLLTLDRQDRFNAFDAPMAAELHRKVKAAAADEGVGAVVLTGAGRAFCAGGDVAAMAARVDDDPGALLGDLIRSLHPTVKLLATMPKPTIAAVNGVVAGGGMGLALGCDLRLAAPEARFKPAYGALGVSPDGGITWLLPRLVGPAVAREMLLADAALDAQRAHALGLVGRVVEGPKLLDEAMALATRLAAGPRSMLASAKQLLAASPHATLDGQLRAERARTVRSASHPDFREGVAAFRGKRPPRFPSAQR